jgi:tagatose 6-phosphate kinase
LEYLVGRRLKSLEDLADALSNLADEGINHVMLSLGHQGILYAKACDNRVLYAKPPAIKAVNTIGCGDSVVASFCMSWLACDDMQKTLRQAVAISAAAATLAGIAEIPRIKAVEFYEQIVITEIK